MFPLFDQYPNSKNQTKINNGQKTERIVYKEGYQNTVQNSGGKKKQEVRCKIINRARVRVWLSLYNISAPMFSLDFELEIYKYLN